MPTRTLDVRGLSCPLPVLRASKAIRDLTPGEQLEIIATDAETPENFGVYCESSHHRLVGTRCEAGSYYLLIEKR